jgi:putative ABC transport system ATP-binding protein
MASVISGKNIIKNFNIGTQTINVLKGITFDVTEGDFVIIFGPSGCGKSTLLHTLLGLEVPTSGQLLFAGQDIYANTTEDDRALIRKRNVGMVYQQPNWVKALTVMENVAFPLILLGIDQSTATAKAMEVLKQVGMDNWATYIPAELSSGQQQRVSLSRALIHDPKVIVADEPTGNLDFEAGQEMMELLQNFNEDKKKTIIMVTHDLEYLKYAKTGIKMLDGKVLGVYDLKGKANLAKAMKESSLKRGEEVKND